MVTQIDKYAIQDCGLCAIEEIVNNVALLVPLNSKYSSFIKPVKEIKILSYKEATSELKKVSNSIAKSLKKSDVKALLLKILLDGKLDDYLPDIELACSAETGESNLPKQAIIQDMLLTGQSEDKIKSEIKDL